jgi:hypothetical protein
MLEILWALLAGSAVGVVGRLVLPGRQNLRLWWMVALGALGAVLGDGAEVWLEAQHTTGVDWSRHMLQVAVAMALIAAVAPVYAERRGGAKR